MAHLPEQPDFEEGIYQIERTDPVVGGVEGISNRQARQLGNRTQWLRQAIEQVIKGAQVVAKATRLASARKFRFEGDASGEVSFDGSTDVAISLTLADSGIKPATYAVARFNAKGLAIGGRGLQVDDLPGLPWAKITSGKPTTLAGYGITDALPSGSFTWASLPGKPSAYPPASHTHAWNQITAKPTTLAGYGITDALAAGAFTWSGLPGKPSTFPPADHTHAWGQITGKPSTLAGYGITDAFPRAGGVFSGTIIPRLSEGPVGQAYNRDFVGFELRGVADAAAFMAFHRVGNYALFLGLDVDNKLKIGGWSMGARAYELVHEGNSHLFTGAPGQVAAFAGALPPAGWLKANGAAVSRATYARLFAAIGTFYGEGDGKSTFNLPDLRGEFIRGWDDARGLDTNRALGSIQAPMLGSHGHTATAAIDGAHAHTISGSAAGVSTSYLSQVRQVAGGAAAAIGIPTLGESAAGVMVDGHSISGPYALRFTNSPMAHAHDVGGTAIAAGAHSHAITVNANGGHETRPRNVALLHCIKY